MMMTVDLFDMLPVVQLVKSQVVDGGEAGHGC